MTNNQQYQAKASRENISIFLLLVLAVLFTYRQVFNFDFLSYDTAYYVTDNLRVSQGISVENIKWAFTTNFFSNWHPLTWLSYMLDMEIWGKSPFWFHSTNVILHIFNSLLVFVLFKKITKKTWECAMVAALFALHPLHIESVAWIAERKDVLSTFFFLLSILNYLYYVQVQSLSRFTLVLLTFSLALMSKPMVVTFPFVLLLLDFWPLGRFKLATNSRPQQNQISNNTTISLLLEKIPFLLLSAITCWLTLLAQRGSMVNTNALPLTMRLANACTGYLEYIIKTVWPVKLAVLYPHPGMPPSIEILEAICLLTLVSFLGIKWWRTKPWLLVGWLWFLGTLIPAIGIVQVGHQAIADRYTYIPHIGLFIILVWGTASIFQYFHFSKKIVVFIVVTTLLGCSIMTQYQLRFWQDDGTLFAHAIEVTGDNYIAESNFGNYLLTKHKLGEAKKHFLRAVQINPQDYIAYTDLGRVYSLEGNNQEAIKCFTKSLEIRPYAPETAFMSQFQLADELEKAGLTTEAIFHLQKAIELNPRSLPAWMNAGKLLLKMKRTEEALYAFQRAHAINPNDKIVNKEIEEIGKLR